MEKTPRLGAQTSIFLSVSPTVEGVSGKYFSDCRLARVSPNAADAELAKRLWEISEKLVGMTEETEIRHELTTSPTETDDERRKEGKDA